MDALKAELAFKDKINKQIQETYRNELRSKNAEINRLNVEINRQNVEINRQNGIIQKIAVLVQPTVNSNLDPAFAQIAAPNPNQQSTAHKVLHIIWKGH